MPHSLLWEIEAKKKPTRRVGHPGIIGSAIVWGATIVGCAVRLKGTECFEQITVILTLGAGIHLIDIWGPLAAKMKKLFTED